MGASWKNLEEQATKSMDYHGQHFKGTSSEGSEDKGCRGSLKKKWL